MSSVSAYEWALMRGHWERIQRFFWSLEGEVGDCFNLELQEKLLIWCC